MNKKQKWTVSLAVAAAVTLCAGVLCACGSERNKPSEYKDGVNYYYGDGQDVHLKGWFPSKPDEIFLVTEESEAVKLHYYNNEAWRNFGVNIEGEYSDFSWLNMTMKAGGTQDVVSAFVKIVNPIREDGDNMNVLGSDVYFDLSEEFVTYSFYVPVLYRQILDVVNDVCLFPDPGMTGTYGDIYVKDAWFSKVQPEGSKLVNEQGTDATAGWSAEAWTGYNLRRVENGEVKLSWNRPAEWAGAFRTVVLPSEPVNKLTFTFTSDAVENAADSVDYFQLILRGDEASWNEGGWWNYYEQWLVDYEKGGIYTPNENGEIVMEIPVGAALAAMEGQHNKQLLLGLQVESVPTAASKYDGRGQMTVKSVEFSWDEDLEQEQPPAQTLRWQVVPAGAKYYNISQKEGVLANVTYADVPKALWANLFADVPAADKKGKVSVTLRNNGSETVWYKSSLDANKSIAETEKYGTIAAGETQTIVMETAQDYTAITLFLDGCCTDDAVPADTLFSGDVDIVSVAFSDGEKFELPAANWQANAEEHPYTFTVEDGNTTVAYDGALSWSVPCLKTDFSYTAAESGLIRIDFTNNNEWAAQIRFDLMKTGESGAWETLREGALTAVPAGETLTLSVSVNAGEAIAAILAFVDVEGQGTGSVTISAVRFEAGGTGEKNVAVNWTTDKEHLSVTDGTVTITDLPVDAWESVSTDFALETGYTKVKVSVTNSTDHLVKFKLSAHGADWNQIGLDSDASVVWLEIPSGATWDFNAEFTAEQAAQVQRLMLMIDCWASDSANAPQAPYNGTVTINSVTIS